MGASSSAISSNPFAFSIAREEYDRIQARIAKEINLDMEDYECLPRLTDAQMQVRLRECFDAAVLEEDKSITECRNPVMISHRLSRMSEAERKEYMCSVVLAAIDNEKANYKPKAAAADYSKSFSGSAADTKNEKEAAELMKNDGGGAEPEDDEDAAADKDISPFLVKPRITRIPKVASEEEKELRKAFQAHDVHILKESSLDLKFLGPSGCFVYINSATKEVVSLRPRDYDEDDDIGGGIALGMAQIAEEESGGKKKGTSGPAIGGGEEDLPEGMLSCALTDLPAMIDDIVDNQQKTPLILDTSSEQKVRVFMEYKHRLQDVSMLTVPFGKSGLRAKDVLENCRKTLVGALKSGSTFCLYMGDCNIEHANFKKKLCKKDVLPVDTFTNAGKRLLQNAPPEMEPRYLPIFRDDDKESGEAVVRGETFRVVVVSTLKPKEWYEKLGECLPTGYMVPVYCTG
jgi:hypothetical protein